MLDQILNVLTFKTVLVAVTVGLLAAWILRRARYNLPPGPRALPLVGNLLQCDSKRMHEQMYEWSLKYGPVISLYMGPKLMVVVNDVTTAMEVLVKKSTDFAGRMKLPSMDLFTDGAKSLTFGDYGPTWHLHRKLSAKALRMYMQGENFNTMVHDAFSVLVKEMEKISGPFDPAEYINFLVGNILTGLCFGGTYDFDDDEVRKVLKLEDDLLKLFGENIPEDFIPGLKYVYKSKSWKMLEAVHDGIVVNFMRRRFDEEELSFDRNNIRHITDFLLLAKLQAEEEEGNEDVEGLTKEHLIQTCADIFFAGMDTSRLTLTFAILDMIAFPDIQEKVFQEIDSVVKRDRLPCTSDRPNLSYTEAVLHECMRLHTISPTGIPHAALNDSTINGFDVPQGTTVVINHWALHHRPDAWNQPERFIPERFLDVDGKMEPKPPNWLPFSAGKRACLGDFVAKPELHILFASFMQRFKWRAEPGVTPDLKEEGSFIFLSPKPFNVVIENRF